jgi:CBS-domain-containing membrane protein
VTLSPQGHAVNSRNDLILRTLGKALSGLAGATQSTCHVPGYSECGEQHAPKFRRFEALVVAANFSCVLILLGLVVQLAWPPSFWFPLINSVALLSMNPRSEAARPWPVVGGHFLTASAGISFALLFGSSLWVGAAAASAGVFAMSQFRASHPPAAATALLFATQPHPSFSMLLPLMTGVLAVAALAAATRWARRRLFGRIPRTAGHDTDGSSTARS